MFLKWAERLIFGLGFLGGGGIGLISGRAIPMIIYLLSFFRGAFCLL